MDSALRDLQGLDTKVGWRIVKRLIWLAANIDNITPERLKDDLSMFYKFRVGDYRVFYDILEDEEMIIIHQIGNRKEIYRKR
ncbi:MAG: type II toxin-antitoxin system RelE family toxin [Ardenticatenaceae bacterium]